MKEKEAYSIVERIQAAYPFFLKGDNAMKKAEMWMDFLTDMDYTKVSNRLNKYIEHNVYEPKIADLKPAGLTEPSYETAEQFERRIANQKSEPLETEAYKKRLEKVLSSSYVQKEIERKKQLFKERRESR